MKTTIEVRLANLVRGRISAEEHERICFERFGDGIFWGIIIGLLIAWMFS